MHNGNILWDELCRHYDTGISQVEGYIKTWESLKPYVSQAIFEEVSRKLDIQKNDAQWWRDACVGYFQTFSKMPLPQDVLALNVPIDSLRTKSMLSDRYGMPTHDENNQPVLVTPKRRPRIGTLPGQDSSIPE